jgi:hypothetical protein
MSFMKGICPSECADVIIIRAFVSKLLSSCILYDTGSQSQKPKPRLLIRVNRKES